MIRQTCVINLETLKADSILFAPQILYLYGEIPWTAMDWSKLKSGLIHYAYLM
jgi:hypothetical protein